jgi:hypothetical protein
MINWMAEKRKKDQRDAAIRATAGDLEAAKDLDWLLQHPNEAGSVTELRAKREREDQEIEANAAEALRQQQEARKAAIAAERKAFAVSELNKHIIVTILNHRLAKMSGFKDLRCDKCGTPLYKARGLVLEASEAYRRTNWSQGPPQTVFMDNSVCQDCKTLNRIVVQVVL